MRFYELHERVMDEIKMAIEVYLGKELYGFNNLDDALEWYMYAKFEELFRRLCDGRYYEERIKKMEEMEKKIEGKKEDWGLSFSLSLNYLMNQFVVFGGLLKKEEDPLYDELKEAILQWVKMNGDLLDGINYVEEINKVRDLPMSNDEKVWMVAEKLFNENFKLKEAIEKRAWEIVEKYIEKVDRKWRSFFEKMGMNLEKEVKKC